MTRKKDSVALFEVIKEHEKRSEGLGVPSWMGAKAAGPAQKQTEQTVATGAPTSEPPRPEAFGGYEPMISTTGGKLRLALDYRAGMFACCLLLVLLVVAFVLGRITAGDLKQQNVSASVVPSEADKTNRTVGENENTGNTGGEEPKSDNAADKPLREKGKYYLVIETLVGATPEDQKDGVQIINFLKEKGVPATLALKNSQPPKKPRYIIWSAVPFDSINSQQASDYAKQIENLGKDYRVKFGKYAFLQQSPSGTFRPYFLQAQETK